MRLSQKITQLSPIVIEFLSTFYDSLSNSCVDISLGAKLSKS